MQRQEPRPVICFAAGQGASGATNVVVGNLIVLLITAWTFLFFSVLSADLAMLVASHMS